MYFRIPGNILEPFLHGFAHILTEISHVETESITELSVIDLHVGQTHTMTQSERTEPLRTRRKETEFIQNFETVATLQSTLFGGHLPLAAESWQRPKFTVWVSPNRNLEGAVS